jgi:hypothetical protein
MNEHKRFFRNESGWKRPRALILMGLAAAVMALCGAGLAEAQQKKAAAPSSASDLPDYLSSQAWKLRGKYLDESAKITGDIERRVLDHLQEWIADRNVTSVEVRRQLEANFAKLRYPIFAWPKCFAEPWKGGVVIGAGYTLGWTRNVRVNVLAIFERRDGKTRLVTVTHFVPYTDLNYELLPSGESGDFRFFVYGTRPGKSHPRLSAMLYAFDGESLKTLWKTEDVYDGKMEVAENTVKIRYLNEKEFIQETSQGRRPPRHEAIYKITPQGLEIETDHEIPF